MEEQVELSTVSHRFWPTVTGAAFGLVIGSIFVWQGFWPGLVVLLFTLVGALAGRYYAACQQS